jgi:hypothetical protein
MKNYVPEYLQPINYVQPKWWKEGLSVFDSDVLLEMY